MAQLIWWFGAIHLAAYAVAGGVGAIVAVTIKAHQWAKVMGRIIQWHIARARWIERPEFNQEPKP